MCVRVCLTSFSGGRCLWLLEHLFMIQMGMGKKLQMLYAHVTMQLQTVLRTTFWAYSVKWITTTMRILRSMNVKLLATWLPVVLLLGKEDITVAYNIDYPSSDGLLNDGRQNILSNNRECKELCDATSGILLLCAQNCTNSWHHCIPYELHLVTAVGCKAWTRIKRTVSGGSREGECWLRNYQPASEECSTCDSGTI